jgi:hypothetical protein
LRLAVLMEVDKTGRDNEPGGINLDFSSERSCGYCSDLTSGDTDVAYCVEARLRVHQTAMVQDDVERLSSQKRRQQPTKTPDRAPRAKPAPQGQHKAS